MMQWSKLKRNIESRFADSVKGRVGLHSTRYRSMHDHDGRAWITLEGKEIINMVHIWKWLYELASRAAFLAGETDLQKRQNYEHQKEEAEKELKDESLFTQSHLGRAMHEYQSLSIEDILISANPLIRALGMLDRRFGIRRLRKLEIASEHPLVKALYFFRCEGEGIKIENKNAQQKNQGDGE